MSDSLARTSYELFVGRHLSPATLATFPVALAPTAVPRNTVHRLRVGADSDIAEIVGRLTERDVELLDIRRCPQPLRPCPRPAPIWTAPPVPRPSDAVVPLAVAPVIDTGGSLPPEAAGEAVRPVSLSRLSDAGARRARRRRRRAARG